MTAMSKGIQIIPGGVRARRVNDLGMRCDNEDMPGPLSDAKVVVRWEAKAEITGIPEWSGHQATGVVMQSLSVAVSDYRFYGILSRFGVQEQIWFSLPLATFSVRAIGQKGALKKRPAKLEIAGQGWVIQVTEVDRIFSSPDRYQSGQEQSLLKAVSAPPVGPEPAAAEMTVLAAGAASWTPTPAAGIFIRNTDGARTGATCLVNPTLPLTEQTAHLQTLDWIPANILEEQFDTVVAGVEPSTAPTPAGRLHSPIGYPASLAITPPADPNEADPALRGYLWPQVDLRGQPLLEVGETVVLRWTTDRPRGYWVEDDLLPKFGGNIVSDAMADEVSWTLTDRRLILIAHPAKPSKPSSAMTQQDYSLLLGMVSPGLALIAGSANARRRARLASERITAAAASAPVVWGVMHLRLEWVCGISVETYEYPKNSKLTTKNLNVVVGDRNDSRISIHVTSGRSMEAESSPIVDAVAGQITAAGFELGDTRQRISDNGKKGRLTSQFRSVNGQGFTIPAATVGL